MKKQSVTVLILGALVGLGCGGAGEESQEDWEETETIDEALDIHCSVFPNTADEAKARIVGYFVADGVATTQGTYRLGGKGSTFENYVMSLASKAGVKMSKGGGLEVARSELGNYYIAQAGKPYPFPILPALESAHAVYPYNAAKPGCAIRHFLAAVLELDGAQGTGTKKQQVLDDPHPKKRAEFTAVWKAIGASSAHASGQSVLISPTDNHVAQCLPNRMFGRVPGGAPKNGLCP